MIYPLHGKEEELMEAPRRVWHRRRRLPREFASKISKKGGELFVSKLMERATGGGNDVGRDVARGVERWEYGNEHSSEDVLCSFRRKER